MHATIPNQTRTQTKNKNILVPSMDNSDDMYQCLDVHEDNQSVLIINQQTGHAEYTVPLIPLV